MLHILLLILKIMGVILAAILGILVLLLCVVLLVPFRYQVMSATEGSAKSTKVQGRISWLFGLLQVRFLYRDRKSSWQLKLFFRTRKKKKKGRENDEKENEDLHTDRNPEEDPLLAEAGEEIPAPSAHDEEEGPGPAAEHEEAAAESADTVKRHEKKRKKRTKILAQIRAFADKIKCTFRKICAKIELLRQKKENLRAFLEDESHRAAFQALKKETARLLRRMRPKRCRGYVRFGFEDPTHTGQVLALCAVFYPFMPGDIRIIPVFEERVLEGKGEMKGNLYLIHLLLFAGNLFRKRAVRKTYKDIREMTG